MGKAISRATLAVIVALGVFGIISRAEQQHARADHACAFPGFNFDTYEARYNVLTYTLAIEAVTSGVAVPSPFSVGGETVDLTYQGLKSGPRDARLPEDTSLRIPPTIMKSIAWIEANWQNASPTVPWGGVGPTIRSHDCGYGLGQVTSGMSNPTGNATAKQALVGTHFLFNLAESVRILASKWNQAPEQRPIAGDGNPAFVENWYFAIWSYNGFASVNHPLFNIDEEFAWIEHPEHPWRDPLRGEVFHCWDPDAPNYASGFGYGDYTYPERVYGCMRYPPRYTPQEGDPFLEYAGGTGVQSLGTVTPTATADPNATPTATPSETTTPPGGYDPNKVPPPPPPKESGNGGSSGGAVVAQSLPDWLDPDEEGRIRMWAPIEFTMPDLSIPEIGQAFLPQNFIDCQARGYEDGCPGMDYPTSLPDLGIEPHVDPTPPFDRTLLAQLLGAPSLSISGPREIDVIVNEDGSESGGTVIAVNEGTFVAPFRIWSSHPWIIVRHPPDPSSRRLQGSVAIGRETQVVLSREPLQTANGYDSVLYITADGSKAPTGSSTGTIVITPLFGSGQPVTITVRLENAYVPTDPTPDPGGSGPDPYPYRAIIPAISATQ
ncbi:MAG: hypothetical protein Kow0010_09890 [Dehalococcoidia bacterium]